MTIHELTYTLRPRPRLLLLASCAIVAATPAGFAQSAASDTDQDDEAIVLDPVQVIDRRTEFGVQGDDIYVTPGAVSSTSGDAIQERFFGNPQEALRSTPGVFTRQVSSQPGIEVNIRGLYGFGRVNAMIDGVPQTYRNVAGHGSSGGSLLYVHPELLGGVDVVRGAVSGPHGAGVLAGAANFRTLGIDDVIIEGRDQGLLTRISAGTNGRDMSGVVAGGYRSSPGEGQAGTFAVMAAVARSVISTYETGEGIDLPRSMDSNNSPTGALLRAEFSPGSGHSFDMGYRWYDNRFEFASYTQNLTNQTVTANYGFQPGGDLINLQLATYYNQTDMVYDDAGTYAGRETENRSYGASLTNTMRVRPAGDLPVVITAGASFGVDDYTVNEMRGGNPPGELLKTSVFTDASLQRGIVTVSAGLRYDYWEMSGYQAPISPGFGDCPAGGPACGDQTVDRSGGRLLPRVSVAIEALEGLQLYAGYAHTFRPPTVQEMLFSLVPIGPGVGTGVANNLDLDPETSENLDAGVNYLGRSVLWQNDFLAVKAGYFHNRIENFIVNDFVQVPGRGLTAMWVNRPGTTTMKGWEIEGVYDAGPAYLRISYTNADTDQPIGDGAGIGNGDAGILPDTYYTVGAGVRLLGHRLNLGAQMRHVGRGKAAFFGDYRPTDAYTLYDLDAGFDITDDVRAFFNIENVMNEAYSIAGAGMEGHERLTGRGRTAIIGLTARF
ncbi:putative TonB-dependent outer membrane heme receptor [Glycocaulis alkaliphilus]|uniref:Putative TonB-dependent outer membrane heme receptor n=1 Tax=Glycocaulis alkaliphilus TaxID=1434191 RepID=A0A3T0E8F8_9PROT|nr:TonB-dependent receptor [Glycocaulis alkaliphilus]AZU03604.1 putative TonB-dependent outer membrane heme receptor [Glycocaulis alkaliphilus]GGB82492.1 hemin receptor [Glycocaulis alkaliphilus]